MCYDPEIQHVESISQIEMEKPTPLTYTQSLGTMTISPELFEKVGLACFIGFTCETVDIVVLDAENKCSYRPAKALCEPSTDGIY